MPGDDEDDYEYTATDISPRQPDKFERSNESDIRHGDDDRESKDGRELRKDQ